MVRLNVFSVCFHISMFVCQSKICSSKQEQGIVESAPPSIGETISLIGQKMLCDYPLKQVFFISTQVVKKGFVCSGDYKYIVYNFKEILFYFRK